MVGCGDAASSAPFPPGSSLSGGKVKPKTPLKRLTIKSFFHNYATSLSSKTSAALALSLSLSLRGRATGSPTCLRAYMLGLLPGVFPVSLSPRSWSKTACRAFLRSQPVTASLCLGALARPCRYKTDQKSRAWGRRPPPPPELHRTTPGSRETPRGRHSHPAHLCLLSVRLSHSSPR